MSGPWTIDRQQHGYRSGHQLLSGSIKLPRADQDVVDRLSDISGPLRPSQVFDPYFTGYTLPSGTHYVLAKTWQDREAPRAGCVRTQSLFVPMLAWEEGGCVPRLFQYLNQSNPYDNASSPADLSSAIDIAPPVAEGEVSELVEALFLEERKPIVVFEARSATAITQRLLMGLWPGLRRNFCVCTFALGPRKLSTREFDLVFAPKDARARFSDWEGRRIEGAVASSRPRHRWTSLIVERLFRDAEPRLLLQNFPVDLQQGNRDNDSILRLSLLWDELVQKSAVSPNAVLGMLDVLNSQGVAAQSLVAFEPLLRRAILMSSAASDTDAWTFLQNLAVKLPPALSPALAGTLADTAKNLAAENPDAALEFLGFVYGARRGLPQLLIDGMGAGLAQSKRPYDLSGLIGKDDGEGFMALLASSDAFARAVFEQDLASTSSIGRLAVAFSTADAEVRGRLRRNILPHLQTGQSAPLIEPLLHGATREDLRASLEAISHRTAFSVPDFDLPLIRASTEADGLNDARNIALASTNHAGADRFLLRSLAPNPADVAWLWECVPKDRRVLLLMGLIGELDDYALQGLLRHNSTRDEIINVLAQAPEQSADLLGRVLLLCVPPLDQTIRAAEMALPHMQTDRETLSTRLLERILSDPDVSQAAERRLFDLAAPSVAPRYLIRLAVPPGAQTQRIARNLVLLDKAQDIRRAVAEYINELTERVTRRRRENLGVEAYTAWARLLGAADASLDSTARAAALMFEHAVRLADAPVYPMLKVAFPILYAHLPDRPEPGLFWTEYDRKKAARHELTDAFLRSNWPPAQLILAAGEPSVALKIVGRLSRTYRGSNYLEAIEQDAERLTAKERQSVLRIVRSASDQDWDY